MRGGPYLILQGMSPRPSLTIFAGAAAAEHTLERGILRRKREVDVFFRGGAAGSDPAIAG